MVLRFSARTMLQPSPIKSCVALAARASGDCRAAPPQAPVPLPATVKGPPGVPLKRLIVCAVGSVKKTSKLLAGCTAMELGPVDTLNTLQTREVEVLTARTAPL
jgi:hypothetical protein